MSAKAGLELMLGLVEDHQTLGTAHNQEPMVLPVIHDDIDPDEVFLKAAFRRAGGRLFRVDPDIREHEGTPSQTLVRKVLTTVEAADGPEVQIDLAGGNVTVSSDPSLVASISNNILLATIARLLSTEFSAYSLVGVAYDADGLDTLRRRLLWELLVQQLPSDLPKSISTFVPIVAGELDYARHCVGSPSARYAVVEGTTRKRGLEHSHMEAKIREAVPDLDRPLVLFIGAGTSASAGIPVGDTVRNEAITRLVGPSSSGPEEAFRIWVSEHDRLLSSEGDLNPQQFAARLSLERVLREEFKALAERGEGREASETVRELQERCEAALERVPRGREAFRTLAATHPRLIVVTVNFDNQIESDLGVDFRTVVDPGEFAGTTELLRARCRGETSELPVLKIHGTIESPDTLVADLDDTEMGLPNDVRTALETVFTCTEELDCGPLHWIWIGCSMRDLDVNQWMQSKSSTDVFDLWVDPLPGPTIKQFIHKCRPELVGGISKRLISELPDIFLPALAKRVDELAAS